MKAKKRARLRDSSQSDSLEERQTHDLEPSDAQTTSDVKMREVKSIRKLEERLNAIKHPERANLITTDTTLEGGAMLIE